jgi:hypothetical protein
MNKNNVPGVDRVLFNFMGKMRYPSKDTAVWFVVALIFGKYLLTVFCTCSIGLSYGLLKAAQSSCFVSYLVTVNSKSQVSRIIGLNKLQERIWTALKLNTLCMTPLISTRMAA